MFSSPASFFVCFWGLGAYYSMGSQSQTWLSDWTEHTIETILHIDFFPHLMHLGDYVIVCVCVCSVAQLCPTPWDSMGCSPPGSSVHGTFQARRLEWVAISSSRGSPWPRDWTHVSCTSHTGRWILCHWAINEAPGKQLYFSKNLQNKTMKKQENQTEIKIF